MVEKKKSKKSERIEKFLEVYTSERTKMNYRGILNKFFGCIGVDPDSYFRKKRNYGEDVKKFFISMKNNAPKTIRLGLTAVKMFLMENDVEFPEKFWRGLRRKIKGSRTITQDRVPSNEELRSILTHVDAKGKALFLMLSSSGMKIGETLQLKLDDIDLETNPSQVNISGEYTKSGNPRIAFISHEAKEAINEWLKIRKDYLKSASARSRYKKSIDDNRLFPFDYSTSLRIWENMLKKSGFVKKDNNTNRFKIHPHVLRKFFRTNMGAIIPRDIVEALMGHEGYLTEVYRKYSEDQLAEFYLKGADSLTVFNDKNGVKKLRNEMNTKMENYDEYINRQALEIERLKRELAKLEQSKEQELGNAISKAIQTNPEFSQKLLHDFINMLKETNPDVLRKMIEQ